MDPLFSRRRSTLLCLIAAGLVSACGGGGGGGGAPTGQAITANYYPNAQHDTWAYDGTSTLATGPFIDTISVNGLKSVLGANTSIFVDDNPEGSGTPLQEYYLKDSRAFTNYGNDDPTDYITAALAPYDEVVFNVPLSNYVLFNKTGLNIGDQDGDHINDTMDARAVLSFNQFERLSTTAGTFSSAAQMTGTATLTVHLSTGPTVPIVLTSTQWRAPNVGLLKETDTVTSSGTVVSTDTLDIRGFRVGGAAAGYLAPKTLVSGIADPDSDETRPGRQAVGTDGTNFLLVNRQQTSSPGVTPATYKWTSRTILGDGTVQTPFDLSAVDSNWSGEAAVAFDGSNYLVLTNTNSGPSGYSGISGQRVSAAGSLVDAAPGFTVAADGFHPAVAYGGGVYLVVYAKPALGNLNLYGRTVLPDGTVGSEFSIYSGSGTELQTNPSVAFDGTNFLVAWEHLADAGTAGSADIYGARVTTGKTVLHSPIFISTATEAQNTPQAACDGTNCLVIWTDRRNYPGVSYSTSPGPGDIYGTRISPNGDALLDGLSDDTGGLAIATGIGANEGYPGLAFDGKEYIAAWSRGTDVSNPSGPAPGIYAARVGVDGTLGGPSSNAGVALSNPAPAGTTLHYVAMTGGAGGTLASWLVNSATVGTAKSLSGAQMYPLAAQ